jgi:hypothetical protein
VERHRPDWYPDGQFDRAAGFRRSEQMVALGARVCLAFGCPCRQCQARKADPGWPFHVSHGTRHCAALARAAGISVLRLTSPADLPGLR